LQRTGDWKQHFLVIKSLYVESGSCSGSGVEKCR